MKIFTKLTNYMICMICMILSPCTMFAMDEISDEEMSSIQGQTGISIYFGGETNIGVNFKKITLEDDDGDTTNPNPGYLIVDSASSNILNVVINNALITLDVAKTGDSPIVISNKNAVLANTTFMKIGLPQDGELNISSSMSDTYYLKVGNNASGLGGTTASLGEVYLSQFSLSIPAISENIYISAH